MKDLKKFFEEQEKDFKRVFGEVKTVADYFKNELDTWEDVCRTVGDFPKVNVLDLDNEIKIIASVTGYDKSEIDIDYFGNSIILNGKNTIDTQSTGTYLVREIKKSNFRRNIILPTKYSYVKDKIKAQFEHGLLTITVPKLVQEKKTTATKIVIE